MFARSRSRSRRERRDHSRKQPRSTWRRTRLERRSSGGGTCGDARLGATDRGTNRGCKIRSSATLRTARNWQTRSTATEKARSVGSVSVGACSPARASVVSSSYAAATVTVPGWWGCALSRQPRSVSTIAATSRRTICVSLLVSDADVVFMAIAFRSLLAAPHRLVAPPFSIACGIPSTGVRLLEWRGASQRSRSLVAALRLAQSETLAFTCGRNRSVPNAVFAFDVVERGT